MTITPEKAASHASRRHVAVLVAVYNGERFLQQQIESLARQDVERLDLWFSDDGSTDRTRSIIAEAATGWKKGTIHLLPGPRAGFAENFRSLLIQPDIDADYVAFCDQDDLWDHDKLSSAIAWLEAKADGAPAIHCSRTRIVDAEGVPTGYSPLFRHPPSFRNAIVQNIAGGNTMVMNRTAHTLLRKASRNVTFVSHDWWCYQVLTGAGGAVHYSPDAKTSYRQHEGNVLGANNSWRARLVRMRMMGSGRFSAWNVINLAALGSCNDLLTEEARRTKDLFAQARRGSALARFRMLRRSAVYRQTLLGQAGLYVACLLRKL